MYISVLFVSSKNLQLKWKDLKKCFSLASGFITDTSTRQGSQRKMMERLTHKVNLITDKQITANRDKLSDAAAMMAMWIGSDFTQKTLNFQQNACRSHKKHNFVTMQKLNYLHSTPIKFPIKEIMIF